MARFVDEVKTAVQASACAVLSANEFVNGAIGLVSPASRDLFNGYVNATRRLVGCGGPDVSPPPAPPLGGQCPGVQYRLDGPFTTRRYRCAFDDFSSDFTSNSSTVTVTGPVLNSGIRVVETSQATCGPNQFQAFITGADGVERVTILQTSSSAQGFRYQDISGGTLTRVDGLPDDCGGGDPVYPPPIDIDIDIDITYDEPGNPGNPINVTIPFVFAPITVNFDGSLRIPFTFDFGGLEFSGDLNLDPELTVNIKLPSLPRGTGDGVDGQPPGEPENEVDPTPPEEKIIGVVVTSGINAQSGLTNIATQNMPNIVAPRLGSIKFAYSLGASTFWSNDIDIKGQRVFIPCPFSQGADAAVASPVPGVSLSFVEIRGFPLATTRDVDRRA